MEKAKKKVVSKKSPTKKVSVKKIVKKSVEKSLIDLIVEGAEDKKAENIEVININEESSIADAIIVCTATSTPHFRAIADGIDEVLSKNNISVPRWEGRTDSNWLVLDLFDVIVHILGREARQSYSLEDLWSKKGVTYHV